ncbi:MAG: hypothetical protein JO152_13975 [Mycobacteriaceae bacterium]|nr:hypothetical protein [Mycobacteriaceae bacterium]
MTAWPHAIPFLPTYIPPDVDLNKVKADVGNGGVSAPAADVPGLRQVVAQAKQKGIDLKVVVIDKDPPVDTPLRDIATEVGHAYPGSTVLAISPVWAGTYSPTFDRVTLEAGQDIAKTGNPVQSANNFLGELSAPEFPWTAFTIALTLGVVVAVVATRALQLWARRSTAAETDSNAE